MPRQKKAAQASSHPTTKELEVKLSKLEAENAKLQSALLKQSGFVRERRPSRWRPFLAGFFATLAVITFGLWNVGYYMRSTLTDQQAFVQATAPLIEDPEIQQALTTEIMKELTARLNLETQLQSALPQNLQFLAGPLSSQIESFATGKVQEFLASPQAADIWEKSLNAAFGTVSGYLAEETNNGTITLEQVYQFAGQELQNGQVGFLFNRQLPAKIGDIQLAEVPYVEEARQTLDILNRTVVLLALTSLVSFVLALVLSTRRRNIVVGIGCFTVVLLGATLLALQLGQLQAAQSASDYPKAVESAFRIITSPLRTQTEGLLAILISGLAIALVTSEWHVMSWLRAQYRRGLDWIMGRLPAFSLPDVLTWIAANRLTIAWVLTAVFYVAFALRMPPTVDGVVSATVASLIAVVVLESIAALVRRQTRTAA